MLLSPCTLRATSVGGCPLLRVGPAAALLLAWPCVASVSISNPLPSCQAGLESISSPPPQITDVANPRYEVPLDVPRAKKRAENPIYSLDFSKDPFGLLLRRRDTGTVL